MKNEEAHKDSESRRVGKLMKNEETDKEWESWRRTRKPL